MDKTGYESVFTRTGPRTAQDCVKPVLCGPVRGPSIFGNIRTVPVHGPSPDKPRTGTGSDFKALEDELVFLVVGFAFVRFVRSVRFVSSRARLFAGALPVVGVDRMR